MWGWGSGRRERVYSRWSAGRNHYLISWVVGSPNWENASAFGKNLCLNFYLFWYKIFLLCRWNHGRKKQGDPEVSYSFDCPSPVCRLQPPVSCVSCARNLSSPVSCIQWHVAMCCIRRWVLHTILIPPLSFLTTEIIYLFLNMLVLMLIINIWT